MRSSPLSEMQEKRVIPAVHRRRPGARICRLTCHRRRWSVNCLRRSAANNISVGRNGRKKLPEVPIFYVVSGSTVKRVIDDNKKHSEIGRFVRSVCMMSTGRREAEHFSKWLHNQHNLQADIFKITLDVRRTGTLQRYLD